MTDRLLCNPSLRQRLQAGDFAGYQVEDATWEFTTEEIEYALYGSNANYALSQDVITAFAKKHPLEVVHLNTWICTDTPAGLWVLRLEGTPIALVWRASRGSDKRIHFLTPECLRAFKVKWESAKADPEADAWFISDDILDMPIAAPGTTVFELDDHGTEDSMPRISKRGALAWIEAEGGLDRIEDVAVLTHAHAALAKHLAGRDYWLNNLRELARKKNRSPEAVEDLVKLTAERDALAEKVAAVAARIECLAPPVDAVPAE